MCDRCFGVCLAHITLVLLAKEMWKCLFVREGASGVRRVVWLREYKFLCQQSASRNLS